MKIKKNGKTIILTESDLQKITKTTLNEQKSPNLQSLWYAILNNHPELKDIKPSVESAVKHIFRNGKFNSGNMIQVCEKTPEFCKVAFTTPEVMDKVFKIV